MARSPVRFWKKGTCTLKKKPVPTTNHKPMSNLFILIILAGSILFFAFARRDPTSTESEASSAQPQAMGKVGWNVADDLLEMKKAYNDVEAITSIPEWSSFTLAYFKDLLARRASVIAWSTGHTTKRQIHFLPQVHENIAGGDSDKKRSGINEIQLRIFEQYRSLARDAQVLAIEDSGCEPNEVITRDVLARMLRAAGARYDMQLSDTQINDTIKDDLKASTRAILSGKTPVICGEEWPVMFEADLIRIEARLIDPEPALARLIAGFTYLRSEIILIKTLEYLRHVNGTTGIIIQGFGHKEDIERFAASYGVVVTSHLLQ